MLYRLSFNGRLRMYGEVPQNSEPQYQINVFFQDVPLVISNQQHDLIFTIVKHLHEARNAKRAGSEAAPFDPAEKDGVSSATPASTTSTDNSWLSWAYNMIVGSEAAQDLERKETPQPKPSLAASTVPPPAVTAVAKKNFLLGCHVEKISLLATVVHEQTSESSLKARKVLTLPIVRLDIQDASAVVWHRAKTQQQLLGLFVSSISLSYFQLSAQSLALHQRISASFLANGAGSSSATWRTVLSNRSPTSGPTVYAADYFRHLSEGQELVMPSDFLSNLSANERELAVKADVVENYKDSPADATTSTSAVSSGDSDPMLQLDDFRPINGLTERDVTICIGTFTSHIEYGVLELLEHFIGEHFMFYRSLLFNSRRDKLLDLLDEKNLASLLVQRNFRIPAISTTIILFAQRIIFPPSEAYDQTSSAARSLTADFTESMMPVAVLDVRSVTIVSCPPPPSALSPEIATAEVDMTLPSGAPATATTVASHWTGKLFNHLTIQILDVQISLSTWESTKSCLAGETYKRQPLTDTFHVHMLLHDALARRIGGDVWHDSLPLMRIDYRMPEVVFNFTRSQWLLFSYVLSTWAPDRLIGVSTESGGPANPTEPKSQTYTDLGLLRKLTKESLSGSAAENQSRQVYLKVSARNFAGSFVSTATTRGTTAQLGAFDISLHGFDKTRYKCSVCTDDELLVVRAPAILSSPQFHPPSSALPSKCAFQVLVQKDKDRPLSHATKTVLPPVLLCNISSWEVVLDPVLFDWIESKPGTTETAHDSRNTTFTPAAPRISPSRISVTTQSDQPPPSPKRWTSGSDMLSSWMKTKLQLEMSSSSIVVPQYHWHQCSHRDNSILSFSEISSLARLSAAPSELERLVAVPLFHFDTPRIVLTNEELANQQQRSWRTAQSLPIVTAEDNADLASSTWRFQMTGGCVRTITSSLHSAISVHIPASKYLLIEHASAGNTGDTLQAIPLAKCDVLQLMTSFDLDGEINFQRQPKTSSFIGCNIRLRPLAWTISDPQVRMLWQLFVKAEAVYQSTQNLLRYTRKIKQRQGGTGTRTSASLSDVAGGRAHTDLDISPQEQPDTLQHVEFDLHILASQVGVRILLTDVVTRSPDLILVVTDVQNLSLNAARANSETSVALKVTSISGENLVASIGAASWHPGVFNGRLLLSNARMTSQNDDDSFWSLVWKSKLGPSKPSAASPDVTFQQHAAELSEHSFNGSSEMVESAQTINLNVQGLDVLLSVPILVGLLMLLDTAVQPILQHMSSSSSSYTSASRPSALGRMLIGPTVHASCGSLRLIVDLYGTPSPTRVTPLGFSPILVFQLGSCLLKTEADSPVIHRLNVDLNETLGAPWSTHETLQYEMLLHDLMIYETSLDEVVILTTTRYAVLFSRQELKKTLSNSMSPTRDTGPNPAQGWNAYVPPSRSCVLVNPVDMRIAFAPQAYNALPPNMPLMSLSPLYRNVSMVFTPIVELTWTRPIQILVTLRHINALLEWSKFLPEVRRAHLVPKRAAPATSSHPNVGRKGGASSMWSLSMQSLSIALDVHNLLAEESWFTSPSQSAIDVVEASFAVDVGYARKVAPSDVVMSVQQVSLAYWTLATGEYEVTAAIENVAFALKDPTGVSNELVQVLSSSKLATQPSHMFFRACLSESFMHNRTADRRLQRQALVEMDRNISVKLAPATVQTLLHGADYFGNAVQSLVKPSAPSPSVPTFSVGRATLLTARLAHLELWLSSSPKETDAVPVKLLIEADSLLIATSLTAEATTPQAVASLDPFTTWPQLEHHGQATLSQLSISMFTNKAERRGQTWLLPPIGIDGNLLLRTVIYPSNPPFQLQSLSVQLQVDQPISVELYPDPLVQLHAILNDYKEVHHWKATMSGKRPAAVVPDEYLSTDDLDPVNWRLLENVSSLRVGDLAIDTVQFCARWRYAMARAITNLTVKKVSDAAFQNAVIALEVVHEELNYVQAVHLLHVSDPSPIPFRSGQHASPLWQLRLVNAREVRARWIDDADSDDDDDKLSDNFEKATTAFLTSAFDLQSVHKPSYIPRLQVDLVIPYAEVVLCNKNASLDQLLRAQASQWTTQFVLNQAAGQGGLHATSVLNFALEILDPRDLHFVHLVQTRAKATTDGVTLDANVEYLKIHVLNSSVGVLSSLAQALLGGPQTKVSSVPFSYLLENVTDHDIVVRQVGTTERFTINARSQKVYSWPMARSADSNLALEMAAAAHSPDDEVWSSPFSVDKPKIITLSSVVISAHPQLQPQAKSLIGIDLTVEIKDVDDRRHICILGPCVITNNTLFHVEALISWSPPAQRISKQQPLQPQPVVLDPSGKFCPLLPVSSRSSLAGMSLQLGIPMHGVVSSHVDLNVPKQSTAEKILRFVSGESYDVLVEIKRTRQRLLVSLNPLVTIENTTNETVFLQSSCSTEIVEIAAGQKHPLQWSAVSIRAMQLGRRLALSSPICWSGSLDSTWSLLRGLDTTAEVEEKGEGVVFPVPPLASGSAETETRLCRLDEPANVPWIVTASSNNTPSLKGFGEIVIGSVQQIHNQTEDRTLLLKPDGMFQPSVRVEPGKSVATYLLRGPSSDPLEWSKGSFGWSNKVSLENISFQVGWSFKQVSVSSESVVWSELLTINDSDHKDKQPPAPLYFDGESRQMSNVIVGRNDSGGVALCDALVVHNHLPVELALYLSGSLGQSHIHTIAARGGRLIPTEALGEESVIWFIPIASKWWVCSRRIRLHKIASWSVHLRDANSGAAILAMLSVASSPAGGLVVDIREHFDPPLLIKNASTVQLYLLTKPAGSSPASASSPVVSLPPDSSVPFDFAAFELEATPFLLISLSAMASREQCISLPVTEETAHPLVFPGASLFAHWTRSSGTQVLRIVNAVGDGGEGVAPPASPTKSSPVLVPTGTPSFRFQSARVNFTAASLVVLDDSFGFACPVPLVSLELSGLVVGWQHRGAAMEHTATFALDFVRVYNHLPGVEFPIVAQTDLTSASTVLPRVTTASITFSSANALYFVNVSKFHLACQPLIVCVEDKVMLHLKARLRSLFLPHLVPFARESHGQQQQAKRLTKISIDELDIGPIQVTLSLVASMRVLLSFERMPAYFPVVTYKSLVGDPVRLFEVLGAQYAADLILRAPSLLGSLKVVGNPTNFFRFAAKGIRDFVALPSTAAALGPGAFVVGLGQGTGSLVQNISHGVLNSVSGLCSSLSRNLDQLSFDTPYIEWQQTQRQSRPRHVVGGFAKGAYMLGSSLVSGLVGIVQQPLLGMIESDSIAVGAVSGLGLGVLGAFTKPMSGMLQLVSSTTDGIMESAGWRDEHDVDTAIVPVITIDRQPSLLHALRVCSPFGDGSLLLVCAKVILEHGPSTLIVFEPPQGDIVLVDHRKGHIVLHRPVNVGFDPTSSRFTVSSQESTAIDFAVSAAVAPVVLHALRLHHRHLGYTPLN